MSIFSDYQAAKELYASIGVDTDTALKRMDEIPVSINCWQIDDLSGFEAPDRGLDGGIAAFGKAPGKPRTRDEYMNNLNTALSLIPGCKRLALHAI